MGVLGNIAGKDSCEEQRRGITNGFALFSGCKHDGAAQSDFGDAGIDYRIVYAERHPIGHLRFKIFPGKSQVANARKDQCAA